MFCVKIGQETWRSSVTIISTELQPLSPLHLSRPSKTTQET
ncbi:unnamed protein product [Ectocarpus sp. 12 AP-2014]